MSAGLKSGKIFVGTIIHSTSPKEIQIIDGFVAIAHGKIIAIGSKDAYQRFVNQVSLDSYALVNLDKNQFIIPGFIDCHVHAPQFPNIGIGLDKPLLEWLEAYTFPLEIKYHDVKFASEVYRNVVTRLLKNGTTTACYFGSLHLDGTLQLAETAIQLCQRALVGKVSMNIANDAGYFNSTEKEIEDTETFVKAVVDLKSDLVEPIITPRFALSCDEEVLKELGKLAAKYECRIQSHISESEGEVESVHEMFPDYRDYADVYDKAGLLTNKCIMAHGVHLTNEEINVLLERGVSIAHCPASNTRLASGMCPVRKLLNSGLTLGLGSDVSGGDSASILDAIRRTMDVSTHLVMNGTDGPSVSLIEAFYLATLGGAKALNLDGKIGNFKMGKEFDALIIDIYRNGSQIDNYDEDTPQLLTEEYVMELLQRFIHLGDDRNIIKVYVKGNEVVNNIK